MHIHSEDSDVHTQRRDSGLHMRREDYMQGGCPTHTHGDRNTDRAHADRARTQTTRARTDHVRMQNPRGVGTAHRACKERPNYTREAGTRGRARTWAPDCT